MACNGKEKKMVITERLNVLNRKKPLTLISNTLTPNLMPTKIKFEHDTVRHSHHYSIAHILWLFNILEFHSKFDLLNVFY